MLVCGQFHIIICFELNIIKFKVVANLHIWYVFQKIFISVTEKRSPCLCKNKDWFQGLSTQVYFQSITTRQKLHFKYRLKIAKQSFLPANHLTCFLWELQQSMSTIINHRMFFWNCKASSCRVHNQLQTAKGNTLLLNVSILLEYNVCCVLYTLNILFSIHGLFLCPFETIYNKQFANASPICGVSLLASKSQISVSYSGLFQVLSFLFHVRGL